MKKALKMGYDIVMERGSTPRPVALKFWTGKDRLEKTEGQKPFKYMADALLGLAATRLNPNIACPITRPGHEADFCDQAWMSLDPHWGLWNRCQDRVQSLRRDVTKVDAKTCADFERYFNEALDHALTPDGIDLKELWALIDTITYLESRKNAPLLYNFGLKFSPAFVQRLHWLYSCVFHLRSVVAVDLNAHIDDPSHEAVRVDSITDYIPKAEYVVNDALLYWQFSKLSQPFVAGRQSDVKVEKLMIEPMRRAFRQSSHNACHLIDHLPASFLERMGANDLEEALYLVQMDWLLGSEAGLLFRLREELYGLQNGYDRIFWHDLEPRSVAKSFNLSLCFQISEKDLNGERRAA